MKPPVRRIAAGSARKVLLDAITVYQEALAIMRSCDFDEARTIRARIKKTESQFDFYDLRGWPPSLEGLRTESQHLQKRLERALEARFSPTVSAEPERAQTLDSCA